MFRLQPKNNRTFHIALIYSNLYNLGRWSTFFDMYTNIRFSEISLECFAVYNCLSYFSPTKTPTFLRMISSSWHCWYLELPIHWDGETLSITECSTVSNTQLQHSNIQIVTSKYIYIPLTNMSSVKEQETITDWKQFAISLYMKS